MAYTKNILITGGAGFIGSHLVRLMLNKYPDYRIINLDKLTYAGNLKNLTDVESAPNYAFVKADICDRNAINDVFEKYEITDVNAEYLRRGTLKVAVLDRGTAWLDTGTFESLMQAGQFVQVIEDRQGLKVGCIEEIAFKNKWISSTQLKELAEPLTKSGYGDYLLELLK